MLGLAAEQNGVSLHGMPGLLRSVEITLASELAVSELDV
jgi:hypothetical protein